MVLESLISPVDAENRPWQMLFMGALFASLAIMLSIWIFPGQASLVFVFLTVMAAMPLIHNTIRLEEIKDEHEFQEKTLLKEHAKALSVFLFLFLGICVAVVGWFVFLPDHVVTDTFHTQYMTIQSINAEDISGAVVIDQEITTNAVRQSTFSKILLNNFNVLAFCLLFSFIYGLGAIFILTWNASVIGVAIGYFIREKLFVISQTTGLVTLTDYLQVFSLGILKYSIHGALEIVSYFLVGLAGGIISMAIIKHRFGTRYFQKILTDCSVLVGISITVLVFAAFLEVYVTPILF